MTHCAHHSNCGCLPMPSRRTWLGGLGAAMAVAAQPAIAQTKPTYEAMLMKCIDPRFTSFTWSYMASRSLENLYSQFNIAGGPVAAVAPAFEAWHKTWWDNLQISVGLHEVKRVIGICHRDCGAAVVAYGDQIKTDRAFETAKLTEALRTFRNALGKRHPGLGVELGIMGLNGAVEPVT
ncbi:MAG: hypothetical protein FJX11_01255 [Alphaproteobacteria bacterium]|nr:hypothetical protein [Alphaproteobacteria bacterium]